MSKHDSAFADPAVHPGVDIAYQDLGQRIEEDAALPRALIVRGVTCLSASSFFENLSLYGKRCGAHSAMCATPQEVQRVQEELLAVVCHTLSSPPMRSALIVNGVLGNTALYTGWLEELDAMRDPSSRQGSICATEWRDCCLGMTARSSRTKKACSISQDAAQNRSNALDSMTASTCVAQHKRA